MERFAVDGVRRLAVPMAAPAQATVMAPLRVEWLPELIYLDGTTKFGPSKLALGTAGAAIGLIATTSAISATRYITSVRPTSAPSQAHSSAGVSSARAIATKPTLAPPPAPTAQSVAALSTALQNTVNSFASMQSAQFFVYIKDLKTGASASLNADKVIESASLYKAFVANQIYLLHDQGLLDLASSTGYGQDISVNACLSKMITVSDNLCGRALGARLGWQAQHGSFRQQGYASTNFFSNPTLTNAHDVGTLFENIYTAKYLKPDSQAALLNLLKNQQVNNRLPQGLPVGTTMAHKTGELDGYMHDAGIVYGPKSTYIIVAMSGPWGNQTDSYGSQAKLSQLIYNQLQK